MAKPPRDPAHDCASLPVARGRVLVRGLLWAVASVIVGFPVVRIVTGLEFTPTGVSNRVVEYAIVIALLPVAALAVWCGVTAIRWILLAAWPGAVGVFADGAGLTFRLGPWGTKRFALDRLDVRYWFQHDPDELTGKVEAFLPEDEQRDRFLPQIRHVGDATAINAVILRRTARSEREAADAFREVIARWQRDRGLDATAGEEAEDDAESGA